MNTATGYALLNLPGFIAAIALYAMLLVMMLSARTTSSNRPSPLRGAPTVLPLFTALLGLAWNLGAFATYGVQSLGIASTPPAVVAAAFSALGFLPAVVVHSVLRTPERMSDNPAAFAVTISAYSISSVASLLHFLSVFKNRDVPSHIALDMLTAGYGCLIMAILFLMRNQPGWRRNVGVAALAVFAVSALHLSHHAGAKHPWWIELAGHHASLPLAAVILYQDYRFAFADIFLKRALAVVMQVALVLVVYLNVGAQLLSSGEGGAQSDPVKVSLLVALWAFIAMVYPLLRRGASWFVDSVVMRRANYESLHEGIERAISRHDAPEAILGEAARRLATALSAREIVWKELVGGEIGDTGFVPTGSIPIATTESPQYRFLIGDMSGGRRLLSDDISMLERVSLTVARRIDGVRVMRERCERDLREQEVIKLAREAELRALRAQINPHFLFNALTTIGYLIQVAPGRAIETLMRLTSLLRGVLRSSSVEFATLGEELDWIQAYLEIEHARFENRLRVEIDVEPEARHIPIPVLLIQPLVENAVKHGIAPFSAGGIISITARLRRDGCESGTGRLGIWIRDTGKGATGGQLENGPFQR
jgi:hypothetical protein